MWVNSVGRVMYSEPLAPRMPGANGGTGPDGIAEAGQQAEGRSTFRLPSKVSLPTESYTTFTPLPPVMSLTRATKSSLR
jgi:hypothetical protein